MRAGRAAAVAALAAALAGPVFGSGLAGTASEVACAPAAPAEIDDPLAREGLAALECALPGGRGSLLIVSDANLSWPVLATPEGRVSFEDAILADTALLGPGLPYVRPEEDRVLLAADEPERVLVEFSTTDPSTMARSSRWLAIRLTDATLLGAGDSAAAAAALR